MEHAWSRPGLMEYLRCSCSSGLYRYLDAAVRKGTAENPSFVSVCTHIER